jgi:hypothetical protein
VRIGWIHVSNDEDAHSTNVPRDPTVDEVRNRSDDAIIYQRGRPIRSYQMNGETYERNGAARRRRESWPVRQERRA